MSDRDRMDEPEGERPLPKRWMDAAEQYNRPPATPRDDLWSAIEARLEDTGDDTGREVRGREGVAETGDAASLDRDRRPRRRGWTTGRPGGWWGLSAAAAAVLALGIGLGRTTAPGIGPGGGPEGNQSAATADAPAATASRAPAVRMAALEHLGRSEAFLSLVRTDTRTGRVDPQVGDWARELLGTTRLLLDTSASGDDPTLRGLLEDLELILVQIAMLDTDSGADIERSRRELDFIARGMDEHDMMTRIQAVRPAGAGLTGT